MRWNYTKTILLISAGVVIVGLAVGNMGGRAVAILFCVPLAVLADVVSWLRHRDHG